MVDTAVVDREADTLMKNLAIMEEAGVILVETADHKTVVTAETREVQLHQDHVQAEAKDQQVHPRENQERKAQAVEKARAHLKENSTI